MMSTSQGNNKAIEKINNKLLEVMNDRGIIASYLLLPLSKITNPENNSQFNLVKYSKSNRVNDLLIHNTKPVTLHDNFLTFRVTGEIIELKGGLLKMITNKKFYVALTILSDKDLMYDFAKEMRFDVNAHGKKSTRNRTLIKLFKSPGLGLMVSASGVSKTMFLPSDPNELRDRLKLLLQERQAGNNSDIINEEIFTIVDKPLVYKCISTKQHRQSLLRSNLIDTN